MRAAALVVTWNGAPFIEACLESVLAQTQAADVLVVDNASTDGTAEIARGLVARAKSRGHALAVVVNAVNLGFTRGANIGLAALLEGRHRPGAPEVAVLLNQDATLSPGCLDAVLEAFAREPRAGAVGCKIYYPDGVTLQHAGGALVRPRMAGLHLGQGERDAPGAHDVEQDVDFLTGAAMALRLRSLGQVGVFDEIFSPGYYEDVDLCVRLREHGWRVLYCPRATATHVESASFTDRLARLTLAHRNRLVFALRWMGDRSFREAFAEAEQAHLAGAAHPDDLRALSTAYVQAMLMVVEAARARLPEGVGAAGLLLELVELLASLRRECLRRLEAPVAARPATGA